MAKNHSSVNDFNKQNESTKTQNVSSPEAKSEKNEKKKDVFLTTENIIYFSLGAVLLIYSLLWFTVFGPSVTETVMKTENRMLIIWLSPFLYFISCGAIYFLFVKKFTTHGQAPAVIFFFIFGLMIAGVNYYNERPNLKAQETEEKIILSQTYYRESAQIQPRPAGLMPMNERQMLVSQLERKANLLQKANQYSNRFAGEYQAVYERLELERALVKVIAERGEPKIVLVDKLGEIVASGKYGNHFELYYLSLEEFNICFNNKEKKKYRASFDDYNMHELSDKNNIEIGFEMLTQPTVIYYWVRNL